MPRGELLADKGIPLGQAAEAAAVAILVIGTVSYTLHLVSIESKSAHASTKHTHLAQTNARRLLFATALPFLLPPLPTRVACASAPVCVPTVESHFHLFEHTASENAAEIRNHPAALFGMMASFPILAMIALLLLLPLGPYVGDHAAFQSLHVIRPDHYARLVTRVYGAWTASHGKLSKKDL